MSKNSHTDNQQDCIFRYILLKDSELQIPMSIRCGQAQDPPLRLREDIHTRGWRFIFGGVTKIL